jgi:hypothetical protein
MTTVISHTKALLMTELFFALPITAFFGMTLCYSAEFSSSGIKLMAVSSTLISAPSL